MTGRDKPCGAVSYVVLHKHSGRARSVTNVECLAKEIQIQLLKLQIIQSFLLCPLVA